MSERHGSFEFSDSGSETYQKELHHDAATVLLYNAITLARGDGSIQQPTDEEGRQTIELYPALDDDESRWHSIGIIIHPAGERDPFKGEHQATVQLGQHIIDPENELSPPALEFIKEFNIYFKNRRYQIETRNFIMDYIDLTVEDFKNRQPSTIEEIVQLNVDISNASEVPADF